MNVISSNILKATKEGYPLTQPEIQYLETVLEEQGIIGKMLNMQASLQKKLYGEDFFEHDLQWRVAYIKEHSIHITQELHEMLYELPHFKPWKDYSKMSIEAKDIAMAKARMELIDAWHFFMNLMLGLGMSEHEFINMYMEKNKENFARQEAGYTHNVSYRKDAENDGTTI